MNRKTTIGWRICCHIAHMAMLSFVIFGCAKEGSISMPGVATNNDSVVVNGSVTVTSVEVVNDRIIVRGNNLNATKHLQIKAAGLDKILTIQSKTSSELIAAVTSLPILSILPNQIFSLIISTANAQSVIPIQFVINNGTITGSKIATGTITGDKIAEKTIPLSKISASGASTGQVPMWDGTTWTPGTVSGGSGGGGITSLTFNNGFAGGPFTVTSPTAINVDTGNTANKIVKLDSAGDFLMPGLFQFSSAGALGFESGVNEWRFFNSGGNLRISQLDTGDIVISTPFEIDATGDVTMPEDVIIGKTLKVGAYTLPAADGANGEILKTNGAGVLAWSSAGGTGTVTNVSGSGSISVATGTTTPVISISNTVGAGTYTKLTVNGEGLVTSGANLSTGDIPSGIDAIKIGGGGVTNTEFSYLDTITSNVQTQLTNKEGSITAGTSAQYFRGDKSWQTLDTLAVPENTNLYFTNTRAQTAVISDDAITNGTTTSAPSENAVFDALALKADATSLSNYVAKAGDTMSGLLRLQTSAVFEDPGAGVFATTIQAPTLAANYVLTLPVDDGTSGQVLATDGSGVLSWVAAGGVGDITGVAAGTGLTGGGTSGDVTLNVDVGTGNGQIVQAGAGDKIAVSLIPTAIPAANIAGGTIDNTEFSYLNGATAAIQGQIDNKVNKAGDTMSGLLRLQTSAVFEDPGAGSFATTIQSATLAANYVLTLPVDDGTAGQLLQTDGAGVLAWVSGAAPTGSAGGDLTGTYPNPSIAAGVIVDADINASAAITATKIAGGTVDNTEFGYVNGVTGAIQTQIDNKVNKAGDTMTGELNMNAQNLIKFKDTDSSNFVALRSPAVVTTDITWTLPAADGTSGQVLATNGTGTLAWTSPGGGGTVTNIATGTGLTGGPITGTGTISIASGGVSSTEIANDTIVDADINTAAAITATKIAGGTVDNTEFSYLNGATAAIQGQIDNKVNKAGDTMSGLLRLQTSAVFEDPGAGSFAATLQAPTLAANYVLTLPVDDGTAGQLLQTDGAGVLAWVSGAAPTGSAGGVLTGTYPNPTIAAGVIVDADINASAAITATKIAGGTVDNTEFSYLNGATAAIQGQIDNKVAKAGDTMSGLLRLQTSAVFEDPGAGVFATTIQSATLAANYVLTLPVDDGTSGQVLSTDGSGVLSWVSAGGGGDITGVAAGTGLTGGGTSGDVTLNVDVGTGNGQIVQAGAGDKIAVSLIPTAIPAANIAGGTIDNTEFSYLNGATAAIQGQIDNKVNKAGDTMSGLLRLQTSAVFEDPGAGSFATTIQSATLAANYVLTLPVDDGTAGQLLQTDGAGVLAWVSGAAPTGSAGGDLTGTYPNPSIAAGVIVDADINASAAITATKIAGGTVDNTEFGYLNGATAAVQTQIDSKVNKAGDTMTGALRMNAQNEIRFADSDSSNYVALRSPAAVTTDVTWTLPAADGSSGQVLSTNGTGTLAWISPGGGGTVTNIATGTGLTGGPITGTGTISIASGGVSSTEIANDSIVDADINSAAAITATKIAGGTVDNTEFGYLNGATGAIQTQLGTKVNKAGDTMSGLLRLQTSAVFEDPGAGAFATTIQSATLAANYVLTLPVDDGTAGQLLQTDGAGVLAWVSGAAPTGSAGGDLTGTYPNPSIAAGVIVDADINASAAITATKIAGGTVDNTEFGYVNGVTGAIQTQIDAKLNKAGDTMTGELNMNAQNMIKFKDSDSSNFVALRSPATVATDRTFTLPSTYGTSGEVLSTDGAGGMSWIAVSGGGGDITGVAAGTGLTGGGVAGDVTLNVDVGTGNGQIVQVGAGDKIAVSLIPTAIPAANIAGGTIDNTEFSYLNGTTAAIQTQIDSKVNKAGDTMSGLLRLQTSAVFEDPGAGSFAATLQSPTLAANYVLTLPVDDGTAGQLLQTDGAGVLAWVSGAAPTGSAGGDLTGTYPNPSIAAGVIVDADINASAAITATKIAGGTVDNTEFGYINGVTGAIQTQLTAKLNKAGDTMTGALRMNAQNEIRFADSDSSNYVALRSPAAVTTDVTWTLPAADGSSGQVLSTNGTGTLAWISPGGGGTVTNIATGTGLTGGPITGTGTISIASGGVSSTEIANDTIVDADINTAAAIAWTKMANLTNDTALYSNASGDVTSLATVSSTELGYLDGATASIQTQLGTKVNKAGDTMSGLLRLQTSAVFEDPGAGAFATTIQSATLAANYVLTLPVDDGTAGQLLQTDGAGVLAWVSGAAPTGSAGGDLTGTYPNPSIAAGVIVDADINASAAITATKIAGGTVDNTEFGYVNGVTGAIQTQIDAKLNKAGDTMTGELNMNAQNMIKFKDSDSSNFVALRSPATVATDRTFILPSTYGTSGEVLSTDGAGGMSWIAVSGGGGDITGVAAGTGLTGGGVAGDVTLNVDVGTGNGQIVQVGAGDKIAVSLIPTAIPAANIAGGTIDNTEFSYLNGTTAAIQTQIDSKVNKAGDTMSGLLRLQTSAVFEDPGAGAFATTIQSATLAANYVLTLPVDDGTAGQLLQTDGAGVLAWVSGAAPTGSAGGDLTGTYPNPTIAAGVIVDADINASAAITATKIAGGTVDNTEFGYINGVTGAIQTQLTAKLNKAGDTMTGELNMNAQNIIKFKDSDSSNFVGLRSPATITTDLTWTLPAADGSSGQVLSTNGTGTLAWISPGGGGTVTNIATGTGLTGGPITGTGTISIASGGVSSTEIANDTIVDADINTAAAIAWTKMANLTNDTALYANGTGDVTSLATVSSTELGYLDGATASIQTQLGTKVNKAGDTMSGLLRLQTSAVFEDPGAGAFATTIQSATLAANYTLTLPVDDGTGGQLLQTDGAGVLSWISGAAPTGSAGGDLTGTYPNPSIAAGVIVDADINASAAITATKIAGGTIDNTEFGYLNGTTGAIQTQLGTKLNKAGDTMTGELNMNAQNIVKFKDSDSSNFAGFRAPAAVTTDYTFSLPTAAPAANGSALVSDTAGNITYLTSLPPSGTAGGDLTGTYPNPGIAAGVIVDADINASAAITATKIAGGTVDNTEFGYINGVTGAVQTQIDSKVNKAGDTMTGNLVAPIMYDYNNTGYYIDPNAGSILNTVTTTGNVLIDNQSALSLGELDINGTNAISIRAPAGFLTDYTLTFPGAVPAANQILYSSDASGNLLWTNFVSGITAGTGISISGGSGNVTVTHIDYSTLSGANNYSLPNVITGITVDATGLGHVTGITTTDLDTRYFTETESNTNFVNVSGDTMTGSLFAQAGANVDYEGLVGTYAGATDLYNVWSISGYSGSPGTGGSYTGMYGMGFCHTNNANCPQSAITGFSGYQFNLSNAGVTNVALGLDGNGWFNGNLRANQLIDDDNSSYYVNPNGTSSLYTITAGNTITAGGDIIGESGTYGQAVVGSDPMWGGYPGIYRSGNSYSMIMADANNTWIFSNTTAGAIYNRVGGNDRLTISNTTVTTSVNLDVVGNAEIDGSITSGGNTIRDSGGGWIRTYGNTGWYSQTYGGGWYMTDTTWLRAYNNVSIYTTGTIRSDGYLVNYGGNGSNIFHACSWAVDTVTSSSNYVLCPANTYTMSGGCLASTTLTGSRPYGPPSNGGAPTTSNGWYCFASASTSITAYALCCNY